MPGGQADEMSAWLIRVACSDQIKDSRDAFGMDAGNDIEDTAFRTQQQTQGDKNMNIHNVFNRFFSRKPEHDLLPSGTFFLIDTANLLGYTGPLHAARTLESVSAGLTAQGYRAVFFLEYRSYVWVRCNQDSAIDVCGIDAFVKRADFVMVDEDDGSGKSEADSVILQVAEALPESVCLTKDKFKDYAGIHPEIVPERVMGFTVVKLDGRMLIAVNGLKSAISIDAVGIKATFGKSPFAFGAMNSPRDFSASAVTRRAGSVYADDVYLKRSAKRTAMRTATKHSKKNLEAIRALAGDDWDRRDSLEHDQGKRRVECERRYCRLRIQAIREGRFQLPHFSAKHREAVGLVALGARLN